MYKALFLIICCWFAHVVQCDILKDILKYYEFLHSDDFNHHIVKRDLTNLGHGRKLDFSFGGKKYHMNLKQKNNILSSDFEAVSIDSEGVEHSIPVDKLQYYKGEIEEDEDSLVIAHIQDKMITAEIISKEETIYIEPLEPHQKDKKNFMVVYRMSDIIWNLTESNSSVRMHEKNCMVPSKLGEDVGNKQVSYDESNMQSNARQKRQTNTEIKDNICPLVLVADYTYFRNIGQSSRLTTMNYMIQVIARVHEIYRTTDFTGVGKYIGFKVHKVIIHEGYSKDLVHRYNQESNGAWNVDQLLTAFSRTDWTKYCLAHLFTYQDFSNGIIGLAYVASPSIYEVGGVCTRSYRDVGGARYLNCGLSSNVNWGRRLLTAEADLVTAHEIGHNFGSNHDPSNCQPNGNSGNYIMYAHSVSGDKPNHNKFSPCSRYAIGQVLQRKRNCFINQKDIDDYCGNGIVENGEECDGGLFDDGEGKKCCTENCKFRINPATNKPHVCSDFHDSCCRNCEYAPTTQVCRHVIPFHCSGETKCTGVSSKCPKAPGLDGNEPCGFRKGNCQNGSCVSLCEQKGKVGCSCGSGPNSCKICCRDTKSSACVVLEGNYNEADGMTCKLSDESGRCVSGRCQPSKRDVKDEFSALLKDFTFSKFVRFMEANIVGTILTLSLLLWIPLSCVVHYIDKKHEQEDDFMKEWMDRTNTNLVPDTENNKKWKMVLQRFKPKSVKSAYHI